MGIQGDCVKNFVKFFREHPPTFSENDASRSMKVAGKRYAYDDYESIKKLIDSEKVLKYGLGEWWNADAAERMDFLVNFLEGNYRQELVERRKTQAAMKEKLRGNGKAALNLPDPDYIISHLQPFRVLGDKRKEAGVQFLDTKDHKITDYDFFSVQSVLRSSEIDKGIVEKFLNQILHVRETYDPFNPFSIRPIEGSNSVYEANRHVTPTWRLEPLRPRLDEDIDKLMHHLFPKDACREFVYTWIYHSLTSRAGTYLYLCGGQGSGKNTLAQLVAMLHGWGNVSMPKQDSLMGRFNHYLKFKRFIFFDEFHCRSRRDKDILKLIINERIQIEGKGRDHEDIDIHASYLLANNQLEAIGLDPIDRRFSVPEVNQEGIVPVFGRAWVQALSNRIKNDAEMVAGFGAWILENFKDTKVGPEEPYQTPRFEEIVLATARFGFHDMLQRVLKKEQNNYEYHEEREAFRRAHKGQHFPPIQDWTRFFREVKKDGKLLGTVEAGVFTPREDLQRSPGVSEVIA